MLDLRHLSKVLRRLKRLTPGLDLFFLIPSAVATKSMCRLKTLRTTLAIVLAAVSGCVMQAQKAIYGYDLHNQPIYRLTAPGNEAVVAFFIATDCPISNRYAPEIARLQKEFTGKQVSVWLVYPNATETTAAVLKHQTAFHLRGSTLVRPSAWWLAESQAAITPEAVIMVPSGHRLRTVYSGRIDNRYVDIGKERPAATQHDLESAVHAILAHQPVPAPGGAPVGCGIVTKAALEGASGKP
jgi:hypothetical protein